MPSLYDVEVSLIAAASGPIVAVKICNDISENDNAARFVSILIIDSNYLISYFIIKIYLSFLEEDSNCRCLPLRCFQAGKDDGRDSQFSQSEFDTCGSSYEHGFMKGCLSVDGNTRDVCNSAEDAG